MAIVAPAQPPISIPGLTQAALDIITDALVACGSQSAGEPVSSDDAAAGLRILNQMMDMFNSQRLMIYTIQRLPFPMTAGKQTYSVGPGGDVNIPRPPKIEKYGIITSANPLLPLELEVADLTLDQWQHIPIKNVPAALSLGVWNDKGFPLMLLNYWPLPNTTLQLVIYPWIALPTFPNLDQQFTFPPAYAEVIKYQLAFRCGIEFPGEVERMPLIKYMADQGMDWLKSMNTEVAELHTTELNTIGGRKGYYNFYSDTPAGRS
jgi:hypothetical protein